jgi:glutathione S-transferase
MGVHAYRWFAPGIPRLDYPHMSHWYARLRGRPGYAPHVMIPLT